MAAMWLTEVPCHTPYHQRPGSVLVHQRNYAHLCRLSAAPTFLTYRARDSPRFSRIRATTLKQDHAGSTASNSSSHTSRSTSQTVLDVAVTIANHPKLGTASLTLTLLDVDGTSSLGEGSVSTWSIPLRKQQSQLTCQVQVPNNFSKLGAVVVKASLSPSMNPSKAILLDHIIVSDPQHGQLTAWCQSWVAPAQGPRIFFSNEAHLPSTTPQGLRKLRQAELLQLRGQAGSSSSALVGLGDSTLKSDTSERKVPERIYEYALYNDFSGTYDPKTPESASKARPTLGGSAQFPYPRRIRTGRPLIPGTDAETAPKGDAYLPPDEHFAPAKQRSFTLGNAKDLAPSILEGVLPGRKGRSFRDMTDVAGMYKDTWRSLKPWLLLLPGLGFAFKLWLLPPVPLVIRGNVSQWDSDREFGRQILAGMHPCTITALTAQAWAEKKSAVTDVHLKGLLGALPTRLQDVLDQPTPRLFCVDHMDIFLSEMPGTGKSIAACINALPNRVQYAARCLLLLSEAGVLLPIAIELIHPDHLDKPRVITPNDDPALWRLAKAHFLVADGSWHQFISHWLRCHACTEPYVMAARRQLSMMHPVMKALQPHFKDTMQADAFARMSLFNAGGTIESVYNAGPFCMRFSSVVYGRFWRFDRQGLPGDLISRGMAIPTSNGNKETFTWKGQQYTTVLGSDYPYAGDGLLIWKAVRQWFHSYLSLYYCTDADITSDPELTAWWQEIQNKGHPDKTEGWLELNTLDDLCDILTTMAWVQSGHHAAVNYGQFDYSGFMPNYPTSARKLLPEIGTPEFAALKENPDRFMLDSLSPKADALQMMGVAAALSTHDAGEEYLGLRQDEDTWTSDPKVVALKKEFQAEVQEHVQKVIQERNADPSLKHRYLSYELQLPYLPEELRGKVVSPCSTGVPNSVSI